MAESYFEFLSGGKGCFRQGGLTYYWRLGKLCIRKSKNEDCSGDKWVRTPKRAVVNDRFLGMRQSAALVRIVFEDLPHWKVAAQTYGAIGQTSDNYMHTVNSKYVGKSGNVTNFKHYAVCRGVLPLPPDMALTCTGKRLKLTWTCTHDDSSAHGLDRLYVALIYDNMPDSLLQVEHVEVCRSAECVEFDVDSSPGGKVHVYPFFGSEDNSAFSNNEYFSMEL